METVKKLPKRRKKVTQNRQNRRKKVTFKALVYISKKVLKKVLKKGISLVDNFLRKKRADIWDFIPSQASVPINNNSLSLMG